MRIRCLALALLCSICVPPAASRAGDLPVGSSRTAWLLKTFRDATSGHVMIFVHRAGPPEAPENSITGIDMCIAMGADAIECDVRKTRDGQYVLMHDKTLDRTTTGRGKVDQFTLAELMELRLRDRAGKVTDERIPTLEQALNRARGNVLVYLDKTDDMIDEVYARLQAIDATDEAVFFGKRPVEQLRRRYGALVDQINYLPKVGDETDDVEAYVKGFAPLKPAAFVLEFDKAGTPVDNAIPTMRATGARIWASPLWPEACAGRTDDAALTDPDANWGWLIDRGVTVFCTDRPRELIAYLTKRGLRKDFAPANASQAVAR